MVLHTHPTKSEQEDILDSLTQIVVFTLSQRQKMILSYLEHSSEELSATKFIHTLLQNASCSESTLWNALRCLRTLGLVDFANGTAHIQLTSAGKIIKERIKK